MVGELTIVLRAHYVDFLGACAESFGEYTENALQADQRSVEFDNKEYALLDDHWGQVFWDWCRVKGGRLKTVVCDASVPAGSRKFSLLLAILIDHEGGHAVIPEIEDMLNFFSWRGDDRSDIKKLDYADAVGTPPMQ